jgi:ferric-dicitrate binding protein FerR (iron transport regulator)
VNTRLVTKIIKKFLEGNCSDEEFAYLLYWYESFDESPDLQLDEEEKELLRQKILSCLQQKIPELKADHQKKVTGAGRIVQFPVSGWLKYAVAIVVVGILTWMGVRYDKTVREHDHMHVGEWHTDNLITVNNQSNRMHLVVLPDSSKVWLSPHSKMEYPERFIGEERLVNIEGEAFFEIYKNPSHPFIVTSGELVTRVLGTSFLLKAYTGAPVEIAVMTGKVAVSRRDDKKEERITLTSKQRAVLNPGGTLIKKPTADEAVVQRWQKVNLSFDNIPLSRVIQALEREFDIRIHCTAEGINQYKLNADFNDQKLADILEMLEESLNIHYEMVNDSVINFYQDKKSL